MADMIVAVYDSLAAAEAALHALQDAGVAYPRIRLHSHTAEQRSLAQIEVAPRLFWSLAIEGGDDDAKVIDVLHDHPPTSVGRYEGESDALADNRAGANAWRHVVFESPVQRSAVGEAAGTSGTTGITSSGAFADGANATRTPDEGQPSQPSPSDTMKPKVAEGRSRTDNIITPE